MLASTSVTAPLLGFLGTVTGMIASFGALADFGTTNPALVAEGIEEALLTILDDPSRHHRSPPLRCTPRSPRPAAGDPSPAHVTRTVRLCRQIPAAKPASARRGVAEDRD